MHDPMENVFVFETNVTVTLSPLNETGAICTSVWGWHLDCAAHNARGSESSSSKMRQTSSDSQTRQAGKQPQCTYLCLGRSSTKYT